MGYFLPVDKETKSYVLAQFTTRALPLTMPRQLELPSLDIAREGPRPWRAKPSPAKRGMVVRVTFRETGDSDHKAPDDQRRHDHDHADEHGHHRSPMRYGRNS